MADQPEQPKIIIDSDWKAQAQKEREKLAASEKEAAAKARSSPSGLDPAGRGGLGGGPGGGQQMPPADFQSLVGTMVTQALLYMGGFPDPATGRAIVSLEHARFNIDLLAVLEEKTKGNLTAEEASDMSTALNELRLRFVEIAKAIAQATKEGRLRSGAGGGEGIFEVGGPRGPVGGGGGGPGGIAGPGLA